MLTADCSKDEPSFLIFEPFSLVATHFPSVDILVNLWRLKIARGPVYEYGCKCPAGTCSIVTPTCNGTVLNSCSSVQETFQASMFLCDNDYSCEQDAWNACGNGIKTVKTTYDCLCPYDTGQVKTQFLKLTQICSLIFRRQ